MSNTSTHFTSVRFARPLWDALLDLRDTRGRAAGGALPPVASLLAEGVGELIRKEDERHAHAIRHLPKRTYRRRSKNDDTAASFVAVLDPNWSSDAGGGGRGAQNHYGLASASSIAKEIRRSPAWVEEGNGLLFVWATTSALCNGELHQLVGELGFQIVTSYVWMKIDAPAVDTGDPPGSGRRRRAAVATEDPTTAPGLGQWSRAAHEFLFVCKRGPVSPPAPNAKPHSIIAAPRGAHSEKPERAWSQVIAPITRACAPGVTGVEFNARKQRPGWAAWGRLDGEAAPLRHALAEE